MTTLSAYRLMWMMVMFDLPVGESSERKEAAAFRHRLLNLGFEMAQYSVYLRFCTGPEQANTLIHLVKEGLPDDGKVEILFFTDKQYERIISFRAGARGPPRQNPGHLDLF